MRLLINTCRSGIVMGCLLFAVPGSLALGSAVTEADEKALWEVWKLHQSASNRHERVVDACQQIALSPTNELINVSRGIAAWHLLGLGKTNEAAAMLDNMASVDRTSPLAAAAGEMARRWLTRLDREKVTHALQIAYRREIAYPKNLDALKKLPKEFVPPLKDRWDSPWKYELIEYKTIKGLTGQRYRLQSNSLGDDSDLVEALVRPYAARIKLKPLSIAAGSGGTQNVIFETIGDNPEKILLSEGAPSGMITFAYDGLKLIILTDGDHWLIVPKPKP